MGEREIWIQAGANANFEYLHNKKEILIVQWLSVQTGTLAMAHSNLEL